EIAQANKASAAHRTFAELPDSGFAERFNPERHPGRPEALPGRRAGIVVAHCPASVATSFQLGSREEMSRAKVHTSVTSVTLSGLPSITLSDLSRVTEISCETNRTRICAVRPRNSAPVISALSIATKRLSTF